ncbi:MAG TPA: hypothetical protein VMH33_10820 [Solirubrobacterales bacterium]|nr:hypothetical protein [Solirubrobacterales bacterium]
MRSAKLFALCICLAALAAALAAPVAAQASFGIKSLSIEPLNEGGTLDFQAGSHPYEWTLKIEMNQDGGGKPEGKLSSLTVALPAGMVANPTALPRCPAAAFEGIQARCPGDSQVGVVNLEVLGQIPGPSGAVYNLTQPFGVPGSIGFSAANYNSFQEASLRSSTDFGITAGDTTIPTALQIQSIEETIWGVPAAPVHDAQRLCFENGLFVHGCASGAQPPKPFFTMPTSCGAPLATTVTVESLEGETDQRTIESEAEGGGLEGLSGCNAETFEPSASFQPTTNKADSPTGLEANIEQPQDEDPEGLSSAHLRNVTVTLPEGLVVNPSSANGLEACSEAQIGYLGTDATGPHFSEAPQNCPNASKLGTMEVTSPLLGEFDETGNATGPRPLHGSVFIGKPFDNPFDSLVSLYLAVEEEELGIVAKLAGKVTPDPSTGRLTAVFEENPQLPLEDIRLHFFEGARASLTTPSTCGTYTTSTTLTPWSTPEGADAHPGSSFQIAAPAGGGACSTSEAGMPNAPSLEAGTVSPLAGTYSPFVLKLTREDGSQQIRALNLNLPVGVAAKFTGRAECSDAQIAQAESRKNPGEGALELQSPSCPSGSELGTATVGAGSGTPFYVTGHVYLGGPYKGAPFSVVAITPAVAGPFDLGVVVVRSALYVNEETAQGSVKTDPIPTILQGIPLQVRSIAIKVDNGDFTLNPTSCEAKSITGEAISPTGNVAQLYNHFQVGGCESLAFRPKLQLSLKGSTKRTGHPALKAVLTYPSGGGYANIAAAQVNLPHAEFLDQGNLNKTCTKPVLLAGNCPASTIYGKAKAWTPLFEKPLEGNVYLVGGYGYKLPALVAELKGQIRFLLVGKVDSGPNKGIRNTFLTVPDAPVEKFVLEMKGGKKYSLLENSENLCAKSQQAIARFTAQNGRIVVLRPKIANNCAGASKHKHHS